MRRGKKSTLVYILKNFWFMLPLTILPAALLGFVKAVQYDNTPADFFLKLFLSITNNQSLVVNNFAQDLFGYFTSISISENWWIYLLGLTSLFFSFCMTISSVERHMRLGLKSYTRILSMLNESIMAVFPYFMLALLSYEFIGLIICGMIYLFYVFNINGWLLMVLSLTVCVVFYIIYAVFITLTICTVPSILSDGYRFNVAVSYSARLVSKKLGVMLGRLIGTFAVSWIILTASNFLYANAKWYPHALHIVISVVYYLFWACFLPVFSMKNYTELTEGTRKDIQVSLF
jgi:hypothetical protein